MSNKGSWFTFFPTSYLWFLIGLCLMLIAFLALLYAFQRKLIYVPENYSVKKVSTNSKHWNASPWPNPEYYRGILGLPTAEVKLGTVVLFHGNAGSALDRLYYFEQLLPLDMRVLLIEYPGYGPRPGAINEEALIADGVDSVSQIEQQFGRPIYVMGESLGSGVAAGVVSRIPTKVDGVILATPWDSLPNLAQSIFWFLPVRWFISDRFDTIGNLKVFRGPIAIVVAEHDEVIPRACTMNLFDSIDGMKRLWVVGNSTHNTWGAYVKQDWWEEVFSFLRNPLSLAP